MVRAQLAREERRRRATIIGAVALAVLTIAGLVGWGIYTHQRSTGFATPRTASDDGVGLVAAQGPVPVEFYIDYLCPYCGHFERETASTVDKLVREGAIQLVVRPMAILDRASSSNYSTRASASAACASDGGKLLPYHNALFAKQPAEGSAGLSTDQLVALGRSVGLGDDFESCVRGRTYVTWVPQVNDAASRRGIRGTPTVYVAGTALKEPTRENLVAAVTAAAQ
jgi:protein-disulfide isomerase